MFDSAQLPLKRTLSECWKLAVELCMSLEELPGGWMRCRHICHLVLKQWEISGREIVWHVAVFFGNE